MIVKDRFGGIKTCIESFDVNEATKRIIEYIEAVEDASRHTTELGVMEAVALRDMNEKQFTKLEKTYMLRVFKDLVKTIEDDDKVCISLIEKIEAL